MGNPWGGERLLHCYEGEATPDTFIPTLIELHRQGRFPFDRMVRFYALADINKAIADSLEGHAVKAVIRM
jgi:aryl-alcohol dehydrogenase